MSDQKHVVFVNEFFHPDICASAVVAEDHLTKLGRLRPEWRITVIAGNRAWDDPSIAYPHESEHDGLRVLRAARPAVSRTSLLRRALGFAAFGRNAVRAARSLGRIDLVMGTTAPPQGGTIARKIARQHGCPYIYKILDLYPELAAALGRTREGSFVHRRWLASDTRTMREAAAVVCVSEAMAERVTASRAVARDTVLAIHDGFDDARLAVNGQNHFQREHNPDGRFVVQYAGNMGLSHPLTTVLDAARLLRDQGEILFQFVGDGPERRRVEADAPPQVRWVGYQPADRLGQVLATADIALISQHDEMFDKALPYKVYATLAAGKPIIFLGSRRSEITTWLEEARCGMRIDHVRADELLKAILRLRDDEAGRREMGKKGRGLYEAKFRSQDAVGKWAALLESVMAKR